MRRGAIVMLVVLAAVVATLTTGVALLVEWLPEQGSTQREGIDFVFWLTTWICVGIWALVAAVTTYSVVKFRVRPGDDTDGKPIHGHTGLEIAWTAVPTVLVVIIGVASAIVLTRNERAGDDALRVAVMAEQFSWSFTYPNGMQAKDLRVPLDRTVVLELQAREVIHSFWVPQWGQKQDAVPGVDTRLVITPKTIGEYPVICTELCGLGHAKMRTQAIVMQPGEFDAWLAEGGEAQEEGGEALGATVFTNNGCGGCHTFEAAGTDSEVGPPLDDLEAAAQREGFDDVEQFVRTAIVDPDAHVAPGFQPNVMPKTYRELPPNQLDALVQYLLGSPE